MVFTRNLWVMGSDKFISLTHGNSHVIDLYEWFHLTPLKRANHLLHYARLVDPLKLPFYEPSLNPTEVKFHQAAERQAKAQAAAPATGAVGTDIESLKTTLLSLQDRLDAYEGKFQDKAEPK